LRQTEFWFYHASSVGQDTEEFTTRRFGIFC